MSKVNDNLSCSWMLEDEAQLQGLLTALGKKFSLTGGGRTGYCVSYLDTFDWRVWRKGGVLEYQESDGRGKLLWRGIGHTGIHAQIPLDKCPVFISDIPDWLQPDMLMEITRPRALIEQAFSQVWIQGYELRNRAGKVVSRVTFVDEYMRYDANRVGRVLARRLQVDTIRGYEKVFARVAKILHQCGIQVYGGDPLERLLTIAGRHPCDYSNCLHFQHPPDQRTDEAVQQAMLRVIQIMGVNEDGIRKDLDMEFMRDYCLAIQWADSLLKQLKHIIPEDTRRRFGRDLVWIKTETRPLHQFNSWLLDFGVYRDLLGGSMSLHMDPLLDWLQQQRCAAQKDVIQLFDGKAYQQFMKRWRIYLECEVPQHSVLKHAEKPILQVMSRRIWRAYKKLAVYRAVKGSRILQRDLLKMKGGCTVLNNLLTLSKTLSTDAIMVELAAPVQTLHATLDRCTKSQAQIQLLDQFIQDAKVSGLWGKSIRQAMSLLFDHIQDSELVGIQELRPAYQDAVRDDMYNAYKQLFKKP